MRSKAVKARIQRNKVNRFFKRMYGEQWQRVAAQHRARPDLLRLPHNWEKQIGQGREYLQTKEPVRQMTVEEMRALARASRAARGILPPPSYTVGVSSNAI
jgi:hypothetical protein